MVEAVANAVNPWGTILAFISALGGVLLLIRRWLNKAVASNQDAANRSEVAATESRQASRETSSAVAALTQQLVQTQQARDREAERNDKVFTALLESQAASREIMKWVGGQNLPQRVRQLEQFAADRETEEHITGQLRLHEMTTSQDTNV